MDLIISVIKKASLNYWEEMFYLTVYNVLTFLVFAIPFLSIVYGSLFVDPLYVLPIGAALAILFSPLVLGMFGVVHEIGIGNALSIKKYFTWAKKLWKEGMIWGAINLVIGAIFFVNINFYGEIEDVWALYVRSFFIGLAMIWVMSQLFALTFYPKMETPSFKLTTHNGLVVIAKRPFLSITMILICFFLLFTSSLVPYFLVFITLSMVALVIDTTTSTVVAALRQNENNVKENR